MEEELNQRKRQVLKAIIQNYMETGEPVGSRTISKFPGLKVSSATIRNEMSDLTDLGYILQPHTSAGRVPSDKGYRLYVDELMKEKQDELNEIRSLMIDTTDKVDKVIKRIAKVLASNTNYATMISVPEIKKGVLKFVQVSRVSRLQLLTVVVLEGNIIRNQIINLDNEIDDQTLLKLNLLLNTNLNGLSVCDINLGLIAKLKEQAGSRAEIVSTVLEAIEATIHVDDDLEVYTYGANNIFRYPELCDNSKAYELISTFEDTKALAGLIKEKIGSSNEKGVRVYIGDELPIQTMKDCSIVTASYELEDGLHGTIGIIGPKRMDYESVVDNLKLLKAQLDEAFSIKK